MKQPTPDELQPTRGQGTRGPLMEQHAAARRRREAAPLGSDDFRAAAEEVARIEVAIAMLEEPPPVSPDEPKRP
jgi:hypothetical protein